MKRRVNLLEEILLAAEPPPSPWRVLSVVGSALAVPILVWGLHARAASQLDPQVTALRGERDRLMRESDQVRQAIAQLQAQNERRLIERARADQIHWLEAFRELSLVVPHGMWLSEMGRADAPAPGGSPDDGDIPIRIRGLAVSQRVVADLLANLETAERFGNPSVIYTQRESGRGIARVGFEIQCALRRGALDARRPARTA